MLKRINFPLVAFLALSVRIVITGATIGDSIALAGLASLYGYSLYLESKRTKPLEELVAKDLSEMKAILSALKLKGSLGR